MVRLAENQMELKPALLRLAESGRGAGEGMDEQTRGHIRNIEVYLARMIEELARGRRETVDEVRSEIKILARTIAALPRETRSVEQPRPELGRADVIGRAERLGGRESGGR
jgi:hypothetical protein